MAILPIDLQVQFSQMGNLGKILSQGQNIAHNQTMLAGEHVDKMSNIVDKTVTQTQKTPVEGSKINTDLSGSSGGYSSEEEKHSKEKEETSEKKEKVNLDPYKGHIIDIRE